MAGTFSPPTRVRNPDMHHDTCVTHVPRCIPGSLPSGFLWSRWWGKRPSIPGACSTRNFSYLVRALLQKRPLFENKFTETIPDTTTQAMNIIQGTTCEFLKSKHYKTLFMFLWQCKGNTNISLGKMHLKIKTATLQLSIIPILQTCQHMNNRCHVIRQKSVSW